MTQEYHLHVDKLYECAFYMHKLDVGSLWSQSNILSIKQRHMHLLFSRQWCDDCVLVCKRRSDWTIRRDHLWPETRCLHLTNVCQVVFRWLYTWWKYNNAYYLQYIPIDAPTSSTVDLFFFFKSPVLDWRSRAIENIQGYTFQLVSAFLDPNHYLFIIMHLNVVS